MRNHDSCQPRPINSNKYFREGQPSALADKTVGDHTEGKIKQWYKDRIKDPEEYTQKKLMNEPPC